MKIGGSIRVAVISTLFLLAGAAVLIFAGRESAVEGTGGRGEAPGQAAIREKSEGAPSASNDGETPDDGRTRQEESALQEAEECDGNGETPDEEERLVGEFDALTDKWMEPSKNGVPMKEVEKFVTAFKKLPEARRDECINRALNLVPDENVMLLVGILFDKTLDAEIVETVFNDVLNRDESVKKPIMNEIFKDRKHSCWKDVAWILDVTGDLPKTSFHPMGE